MYVLCFVGGLVVGIVVTAMVYGLRATAGTLQIDHSNPEKDVYRFNVNDLDKLSKKKRIVLKVDNNASISQK